MPDWKVCEGQLLDGKYPLESYVAGDENSALFLTQSGAAAIRIRRAADAVQAAELVGRWNRVKRFPHPHLIKIETSGASELAGEPVAYVVMEHAEETLGGVLRARPLRADEARAMVMPVAVALDYLHRRGMAHGAVKPSHIFAVGDTVKVSSESIVEGEPDADIRALGLTVIDALAPRTGEPVPASVAAENLPAPFDRIVAGCLDPDPKRRWTADKVVMRLRLADRAAAPPPVPAPKKLSFRRLAGPAGLTAIAAGVLAGVMLRRPEPPPSPVTAQRPRPVPATVAPVPVPMQPPPPPPSTEKPRPAGAASQSTSDRVAMDDGVALSVTPDVPQKARNTISGKPAVVVRVTVDPAGHVTNAAVERTFSPYFSKFALEAVRKWKFIPVEQPGTRQWLLRFEFTPSKTHVVAQEAVRE